MSYAAYICTLLGNKNADQQFRIFVYCVHNIHSGIYIVSAAEFLNNGHIFFHRRQIVLCVYVALQMYIRKKFIIGALKSVL